MNRNLRCSFCRRTEHEVPTLVAGASAYICGDCVALAQRAIDVNPPPAAERTAASPPSWREWLGRVRGWLGLKMEASPTG